MLRLQTSDEQTPSKPQARDSSNLQHHLIQLEWSEDPGWKLSRGVINQL